MAMEHTEVMHEYGTTVACVWDAEGSIDGTAQGNLQPSAVEERKGVGPDLKLPFSE